MGLGVWSPHRHQGRELQGPRDGFNAPGTEKGAVLPCASSLEGSSLGPYGSFGDNFIPWINRLLRWKGLQGSPGPAFLDKNVIRSIQNFSITYLRQPMVTGQSPAGVLGWWGLPPRIAGHPPSQVPFPGWPNPCASPPRRLDPPHGYGPFLHPFSAIAVTANHRVRVAGVAGLPQPLSHMRFVSKNPKL